MADVRDGLPLPPAQAIRHALEIFSRASADWRGNGSVDAGPLHWPVAVNLARRQLAQALEVLSSGGRPQLGIDAGLSRCVCGRPHCPGACLDSLGWETADAGAGIAWWNSLTPTRRSKWLDAAHSARPADAWSAFKAQGA